MDQEVAFWTAFGAIGQAVGAIATAAAVIVALWATLSEREIRVSVGAGLRLIISGDGTPAIDVISITVSNQGLRSARIRSIGWRTGWLRHGPSWLKHKFAFQNASSFPGAVNPPFDLEPGEEKTILIEATAYSRAQDDVSRRDFFHRKLPFSRDPVQMPVHAMAFIVGAKKPALSRVETGLAWFLAKGKIQVGQGADHFNEQAAKKRTDATERK